MVTPRRGRGSIARTRRRTINQDSGSIMPTDRSLLQPMGDKSSPIIENPVEYDTTKDGEWHKRIWGPDVRQILRSLAVVAGHARQHLSAETLFQVVLTEDQLRNARKLQFMQSTGLIKGVFRSTDGKIHSLVNLREVNPATASALVSLPMYQAMEEVISTLQRIEAGIQEILRGQHADRIGALKAGLEIVQHASLAEGVDLRRALLQSSIPVLLTAKWQLFEVMRKELGEMSLAIGEGDLWKNVREMIDPKMSRERIASSYMNRLHENCVGATKATAELARVYMCLGESRLAVSLVENYSAEMREVVPHAKLGIKYMTAKGEVAAKSYRFWDQLGPNLYKLPAITKAAVEQPCRPLVITFRRQDLIETEYEEVENG